MKNWMGTKLLARVACHFRVARVNIHFARQALERPIFFQRTNAIIHINIQSCVFLCFVVFSCVPCVYFNLTMIHRGIILPEALAIPRALSGSNNY